MTPRLLINVLTMEARRLMSYRVDFWINALVAFFVQIGVVYFLWKAVFSESGKQIIGGYDFHSMVYYYILVVLLGKFIGSTGFETGRISQEIYDGSLTRYLIYPTQYFPFKYAQHLGRLGPALVQFAIFGTGCVIFFSIPDGMNITPASVLMAASSVFMANLLNFILFCPTECVAFWQDNVWSLNVMMRFVIMLLGGGMLPLTVFPTWAQDILFWLPFQYMYHFPVNALMGKITWHVWLSGLGVSLIWCLLISGVTRIVWRRGMVQYTGVGI